MAHTRSESYSHWYWSDTGITGVVNIPLREVMLLYYVNNANVPAQALFESHLQDTTSVQSSGEHCKRTSSDILSAASGFIKVELQFDCATSPPDTIRFGALFDVAPAHVHYAKLHRDGMQIGEALLSGSAGTWNFGNVSENGSWDFGSFAKLGIEHIAGGVDHIAFLFGLLLIARSTKRAVIAVTGFTLGHSISLAAAVIGFVSAESKLVEAFIGFTVMLVAVEYFLMGRAGVRKYAVACALTAWIIGGSAYLLGAIEPGAIAAYLGFGLFAACYLLIASEAGYSDADWRPAMPLFAAACCFGLVHGFGFAGFLLDTGLLGGALFVPLLGFNLGVELGQLVIVAAAVLAVKLCGSFVPKVMPQLIAATLCGVGVYWFVGRTLS